MATEQGICKNCGSLLMVNSNDDLCECVFCDCVFPSAEAIEIFNNPDGVEFPNLPQPKRDAKASRHTVTPVFEDVVEKAVKVDKAVNKETKVEKLFELSPDDVKTPKKVKTIVYAATAACLVIVLGISIPLCVLRTSHAKKIENNITRCISDAQMSVSTVVEDSCHSSLPMRSRSLRSLRPSSLSVRSAARSTVIRLQMVLITTRM